MPTQQHHPHRFVKKHENYLEEIGDYMTSTVLGIDADTPVQEAARYMHSKNVGSLLVKDKEDYVGIVTETNLSQTVVAKGLDSSTTKVSEVMSHPLLTLERSEQVEEANKFMAKHKIRHLGVTENGKIIGVLSVKDLVSYYANPRLRTW